MDRRGTPAMLPLGTRRLCVLAAALSALPLMLLVPVPVAALAAAAGLAMFLLGRRRRVPSLLLVPLVLLCAGLVFVQHDFRLGRDTGSALLLVMLALKLGEASTPRDGRALVGFALFATFAALLQDQGPLTLALSLPPVLAMLAASARLAMPHELASAAGAVDMMRELRRTGGLLLLALPIAMAGFWLFPRLGNPIWGVPENAVAKPGVTDQMGPGDWLEVLDDSSVALRVRFDGAAPRREDMYWRGPVLWRFDGRVWSRPDWTAALPAAELSGAREAYRYELTMEPSDRRFLFKLDLPGAAPEGGRLHGDLSVIAHRPVNSLRRYSGVALAADAVQPGMPTALRNAALAIPEGFNPRIREEVTGWRDGGLDDEAVIQRALDWFRADFSYSLAAPPLGRHSVDEFMYETRVGFCEHFTSSFVFMMRSAGIPARVVLGYVGGYQNPFDDHWRVQQSDAHAWAEVWLEGRGWIRIDPTAAVDPSRVFDRYGPGAGAGGGLAGLAGYDSRLFQLVDAMRRGWNDVVLAFNAERQRDLVRRLGVDNPSQWQVGLAFVLAAGAALAVTLWLLLRGRREPGDPLSRAWAAFIRRLARAGVDKPTHETALAFGRRSASHWPGQADELLSLSRDFARLRYAPGSRDTETAALVARLRAFRPGRRTRSRKS